MKPSLSAFLLCASLAFAGSVWATTLPDSCGNDKVKFNVKTEEGQPVPAGPADGKSQIIFIEDENQPIGPFMHATVRLGMDGAWLGANNGNSYFAVAVDPGVHQLCASWEGKNVEATSFTAEPSHVYYFAARVTVESRYSVTFNLAQLNEDEGKYLVKGLKLSTSKPK